MIKFKNIISGAALVAATMMGTSCSDWLDLEPQDWFGSESYWKNESQIIGYVDGMHKQLRDQYWQHTILFGEVRGGQYVDGVSCDGMTTWYGDMRLQNLDVDHTGVSKFGNLYGTITNCNLFIKRVTEASFLSDEARRKYLAIGYGLRAFHYFDLYRVYGGVPLRTDVDVIEGVLDPNKLYLARSTPKQTMDFIKEDINKSIELFGSDKSFDPVGHGKKYYWCKAASECLAAEIYLWNAKVTIGDNQANAADLAKAKELLKNIEANYGLSMLDNFGDVFDAKNKVNDEVIFAIRFQEGEATNNNVYYTYSLDTGSTQGLSFRKDGSAWNDPLGLKTGYAMSMEYKKGMYEMFDEEDSRLDATFMGSFRKNEAGELYLNGVHTVKNVGYINSAGNRIFCGDYILYRLPWVYLSLAEIANMEGNDADVEKYVNLVRQRAYAENWNAEEFGYKAGDFTQNELAIFGEKNKEFVQEGQRWWDLLRMTYTKGGEHLVFRSEVTFEKDAPLLNQNNAYKVLWPLDKELLNNDNTLLQTPGYGGDECQW